VFKKLLAVLALACAALPCFAQQNSNNNGVIFPLQTFTAASVTTSPLQNPFAQGGHFIVFIQAVNSGTVTVTINGFDPNSGQSYVILTSTALASAGVTVLRVYPGLTNSNNLTANDIIPEWFTVNLVGASTPSIVLSVTYMFDD
jgi:hypothetical protein